MEQLEKHLEALKRMVKHFFTDEENIKSRSTDHTEDLQFFADCIAQPETVAEVQSIAKYCHAHQIFITVRGAGTGLSGGALPVFGGLIMDMSRMNKILDIDSKNFQVTTEPGVITQVLQETVQEKGLFYPVDPASKGSCFIGGNIAENSGGPRAVKYGVVKDYVLNLEVVLANGEVMWTGANTLKNATGYNLTQLIVGSEGTLGIVTKIVLKLIPDVPHQLLILVPFKNIFEAGEAVNEIFLAGITPSALEFMESDALNWAMQYSPKTTIQIEKGIEAHLLIEVDGQNVDELYPQIETIAQRLSKFDIGEILFAESHEQKQNLWHLRRIVGEAVKSQSIYKEEDTVVPRAELPVLLKTIKEIGKTYGFKSVCYGHAGDGNLHVNIIKGDLTDQVWHEELPKAIREIFSKVKFLKGTISGEHGIGFVQKNYMDIPFSNLELDLMKGIKNVFDPKGILNPGKIFPDVKH